MNARSVATLVAIAFIAYFVADVAHEGFGHGAACLALGGRVLLLDTTFEACSIRARLIDGAGPAEGIVTALLAWGWLRYAPPRAQNLRVLLCLVFAFAIFWNVGYLTKSGLTSTGDWHFVIAGLQPAAAWHIAMAIAGVALYIGAMRMLARVWPASDEAGMTSFAFADTAYLAAAVLSAGAGALDPRGPATILTDALPSSLGAIGLVLVGYRSNRRVATPFSAAWIAAGVASAVLFIAVLGPGFRFD